MRTFFLTPEIIYEENVPAEVQSDIDVWFSNSDYGDSPPFSTDAALFFLIHPFQGGRAHIFVESMMHGYLITIPWAEGDILYHGDKTGGHHSFVDTLPE